MIESISVAGEATFGPAPETMSGLSQFNFLFGSNGTGKTTISRIIADEKSFPTCGVKWKAGTPLEPLVYNHDFVERNFNQSAELKGVFTLGEKNLETLAKVAAAKEEIDALTNQIQTLSNTLHGEDGTGGKRSELTKLESWLKEICWSQKQKHDESFRGAFEGYRNSAEKFKVKVLQEQASNTAVLSPLHELQKKAEGIFDGSPSVEEAITIVDGATLLEHEQNPILKKIVVGKEDVDIAAMIKKLENSDWVREGRRFYAMNDGLCPFCQQEAPHDLARSLDEYFDDAFLKDTGAIDNLATSYSKEAARVQQQLDAVIASPSKHLDREAVKGQKDTLDALILLNTQRIAEKKREPSRTVELKSVGEAVASITSLVDSANQKVAAHNKMVANLKSERQELSAQIWRFVLEQIKPELAEYKKSKDACEKAISSLQEQIGRAGQSKAKKVASLLELEKQTTSIQPTIDSINSLLESFGYRGFKLAKSKSGTSYKLVRLDGSDAKKTLSEGEKTFVTFLYFYHLLKGSESESGMTTDRIVVFDDPVSSLDSDILFIVGSLIKEIFDEVRAGKGHIKQVFVLTHNVYFHKEVTYNSRRRTTAMAEETFWIVRKPGAESKIEKYPTNPIKTSYELLWAEVRRADRSNLTIQNILRRILENYFKILGGIDLDDLGAEFQGQEKVIFRSLCAWVHDGSHFAHDDLYVSIDGAMVEAYLKVFRRIFETSGHPAHYRMMMGDAYAEEPDVPAPDAETQNGELPA